MNKQQGIISPIVIVIIVIAVLGVGGYVAYTQYSEKITQEQVETDIETNTENKTNDQQETNTNETTTQQQTEIAGWKTYTNVNYGYAIKYPSNGSLSLVPRGPDGANADGYKINFSAKDFQAVITATRNINNNKTVESLGLSIPSSAKKIFIDSSVAYEWVSSESSGEKIGATAVVFNGGEYYYIIQTFCLRENYNGPCLPEFTTERQKNFDTFLSTFKFTTPTSITADQQIKINNFDYSFVFTTDSVKIYDAKNSFLQELKIGKDEMESAKFSLKNYGRQIIKANDDLNFDGYKDLAIEIGNGYSGVNFFYNFYYFNPTTKKFVEVPELKNVCNPNVKPDQKQILSSCKDGPGYSESIYQFGAAGHILTKIPKIYRIDPESATVGSLVGIYGNNFSGFEGDLNVWIENSSGVKGIIYGDKKLSNDYEIKFNIPASVCQQDNSYTGFPCSATLQLIPGKYKIYVHPWGAKSNIVNFEIK
jgi:Tfp pilus assembly protein PilE